MTALRYHAQRPMRRLDQLISSLGYCSRKQVQALCDAGRIRLASGPVLDDASLKVSPTTVLLDDEPLEFPGGLFLMLHKPVGLVCSHDSSEGPRVYDLLPKRWLLRDPKVTSVGRLDKNTSGLLLLTDQGPLVQRLTSPKHHVDKTYVATLNREPSQHALEAFSQGVELQEKGQRVRSLPAAIRVLEKTQVEVTLQEGKYHQVRRMFSALGLEVQTLHRIRFGDWTLGELPPGAWRELTVDLK